MDSLFTDLDKVFFFYSASNASPGDSLLFTGLLIYTYILCNARYSFGAIPLNLWNVLEKYKLLSKPMEFAMAVMDLNWRSNSCFRLGPIPGMESSSE